MCIKSNHSCPKPFYMMCVQIAAGLFLREALAAGWEGKSLLRWCLSLMVRICTHLKYIFLKIDSVNQGPGCLFGSWKMLPLNEAKHTHMAINSIEFSGTSFWVNMHRFPLLKRVNMKNAFANYWWRLNQTFGLVERNKPRKGSRGRGRSLSDSVHSSSFRKGLKTRWPA